jgi:hypothetical protein
MVELEIFVLQETEWFSFKFEGGHPIVYYQIYTKTLM